MADAATHPVPAGTFNAQLEGEILTAATKRKIPTTPAAIVTLLKAMFDAGEDYYNLDLVLRKLQGEPAAPKETAAPAPGKTAGTTVPASKSSAPVAPAPAPASAAKPAEPVPAAVAPADSAASSSASDGPSSSDAAAELGERLTAAASHANLSRVIEGLLHWRSSATDADVDVLFESPALAAFFTNVVTQRAPAATDSRLVTLLTALLSPGEVRPNGRPVDETLTVALGPAAPSAAAALAVEQVRAIIAALQSLEEAVAATPEVSEAVGSAATAAAAAVGASVASALAAHRHKALSIATSATSGRAHESRAAALQKQAAATHRGDDMRSVVIRRAALREAAMELAAAGGASATEHSHSHSDSHGHGAAAPSAERAAKDLEAAVGGSSTVAAGGEAAFREDLERVRAELTAAVEPASAALRAADERVAALQTRRAQLQREMEEVTEQLRSAQEEQKRAAADKDRIGEAFRGRAREVDAKRRELLLAVRRSDAATAVREAGSALSAKLQAAVDRAAEARHKGHAERAAEARTAALRATAAYLAEEAELCSRLAARAKEQEERCARQEAEIQHYQRLGIRTLEQTLAEDTTKTRNAAREDRDAIAKLLAQTTEALAATTAAVRARAHLGPLSAEGTEAARATARDARRAGVAAPVIAAFCGATGVSADSEPDAPSHGHAHGHGHGHGHGHSSAGRGIRETGSVAAASHRSVAGGDSPVASPVADAAPSPAVHADSPAPPPPASTSSSSSSSSAASGRPPWASTAGSSNGAARWARPAPSAGASASRASAAAAAAAASAGRSLDAILAQQAAEHATRGRAGARATPSASSSSSTTTTAAAAAAAAETAVSSSDEAAPGSPPNSPAAPTPTLSAPAEEESSVEAPAGSDLAGFEPVEA